MSSLIINSVLANYNEFLVVIRLASTIADKVVEANAKNIICGGVNTVDAERESGLLRQELENFGFDIHELGDDESLYDFFVKPLIQEINKRSRC